MIAWVAVALGGTVDGRVTDSDGAPIEGVNVVAYDRRFRFANIGTDADGRYTLEDLPEERYRMRFIPPSSSFAQENWAGETLAACEATPHPVADSDSLTVDVALPTGGVLTGQVFRRDHSPLAGTEIESYPTWYREVSVSSRVATTDEEGHFELRGLPRFRTLPETVLVELRDGQVPEQYYRGAWLEEDAEPVGTPEAITDLGAFSVREGVTLSGDVLGPDGPVEGAEVHVFAGRHTHVALTDANGEWTQDALAPGEILIWATAPGHARTYWPDLDRPPEERLTVDTEGAVLDDVDFLMVQESVVTGTLVTSGDTTLASVFLVNDDDSVGLAAAVAADGTFSRGGLQAGVWTVEVYGVGLGFVEGPLIEDDTPVSVTVGPGATVDLGRLEPLEAARIEGIVTDPVSGDAVYGAAIIAENQEDQSRRIVFSDLDGSYTMNAMAPGSWSIQVAYSPFCTVDGGWVSVYWPQQVNPSVGGTIDLSSGEVFGWSPQMPPDADLDEMGDDWEVANGLDPTVDDAAEDPDGDGFVNLVEYRLGTDPQEVYDSGCSCAGTRVALVLVPFPLLGLLRRRRLRA